MKLDKSYWDQRYASQTVSWDVKAPSSPLMAYFDQLKDKTRSILIPGCGYAHEARYLADLGFTNITVIDIADQAIEEARSNLKATSVRLIQGDIFSHEGQYDLVIEQTMFCAFKPSQREKYLSKVRTWLSPKGKYIGLLFGIEFEKPGPPFGGSKESYLPLFSKYFSKVKMDLCYNSIESRSGNELFFTAMK